MRQVGGHAGGVLAYLNDHYGSGCRVPAIARDLGIPADDVRRALYDLEQAGQVFFDAKGWWRLAPRA